MTIRDGSVDEPVDIIGITEYAAIHDKNREGLPHSPQGPVENSLICSGKLGDKKYFPQAVEKL